MRALITVSGLTVVSRVAGFVRDALTAMFMGAGFEADAFFVAQRLPNLFRSLFAEGAFAAAFVPLYTAEKEKKGEDAAQRFAGEAMSLLIAFLIPLTLLFIGLMPWVMRVMAPGFHDEPLKFDLAVRFSRVTFPYLLLISITALQTGVLNARGRFAPGAAAPVMLNIVMIGGLLISDLFGWPVGETQSWALTISGGVQALWLAISCYQARVSIPMIRPRLTQASKRLFKHIGPGAIGAGATQINLLLTTILASTLPTGAVSYLYYADRLNQLPLGIVGIAVATTLLPILSQHEAQGDIKMVRHYISRGIEFCLALGLPAAVGLGLAAQPIIQTLFEHGAFSRADTIETAKTLSAYAIGIPAFLLVKALAARFFARHDTRTPVKIAIFSMLMNITIALILLEPMRHVGMALATSIATWSNAILLWAALNRRGEDLIDDTLRRRAPRMVLCAVLMGALTLGLNAVTAPLFTADALTGKIAGLAAIIGLSSLAYGVLLPVTGAFHWSELAKYRKRPKGKPTNDELHI